MKRVIDRPRLLTLPSKQHAEGWIAFAELEHLIKWPVKRMFWIKNVPIGAKRGVHAHLKENQILFCLSGSVQVSMELLDGSCESFHLDSADYALSLPALVWSEITFHEAAVLLVISDQLFEEENYIRNKVRFKDLQLAYEAGN
jgi:hypothetical protein